MSAAHGCLRCASYSAPVACSLNERDITLGEKVAKGSEGEVWKGELRGHGLCVNAWSHVCQPRFVVGTVAIKIAIGIGSTFDAIHDPVWREAEVSGANASCLALILTVVFVQL